MDVDQKINMLAAIVKDLVETADPQVLNPVRRYNIMHDLERIMDEHNSSADQENEG
jgi:hypothetical protein